MPIELQPSQLNGGVSDLKVTVETAGETRDVTAEIIRGSLNESREAMMDNKQHLVHMRYIETDHRGVIEDIHACPAEDRQRQPGPTTACTRSTAEP